MRIEYIRDHPIMYYMKIKARAKHIQSRVMQLRSV